MTGSAADGSVSIGSPRVDPASGGRPGPVVRVLLSLIGVYRTAISPLRPPSCRYLPTCSEYALDALRTWGLLRGGVMAVRRLLRCHPWHAGGYDPVPPRTSSLTQATV